MPEHDESFYREQFEDVFTRLMECGWISEFGFHEGGGYGLKLTDKGKERAEWVRLISMELELGQDEMVTLMVIAQLHAPGAKET